ncbi:MAG TPA: CHRD domain-containing protein [Caldimonas sp.]|jgi:hypothetical protein|nr:CHRD domain-containing protein [Caldimonas sp.]HEX2542765.1 CHRD domain-containing protein [Caldimonas sp.]
MFRPTAMLAAFLAASAGAHAAITIVTPMTIEQEPGILVPTFDNGQLRPRSFGTATFVINDAFNTMSFTAVVNNIDVTGVQTPDANDNLVAAHIHAGPDTPLPTKPVVWGFFGMPFNNNNPADLVITPFADRVGGTFTGVWDTPEGQNTTFLAQLPNIIEGRAYINFHTSQFPGGEIRGNIPPVPEPETYALMLAGLGAVGWLARRRKQRRHA